MQIDGTASVVQQGSAARQIHAPGQARACATWLHDTDGRATRHTTLPNAAQVKAKGARKIGFNEFVTALDHVAAKKKITSDELAAVIVGSSAKTNATNADYVKFHVSSGRE